MANDKVLVEVYGGTNQGCGSGCSACGPQAGCGPSVPTGELFISLDEELQNSHEDKVEVKYFDTDKDGLESYPLVRQAIEAGYPFPIIAVNGQPRLAGTINIEMIKKLLNELS